MSYSTVEARVQTIIQAMANFADADVTRGDWRNLNQAGGPYCVLSRWQRLAFGARRGVKAVSFGAKISKHHTIAIEVFERIMRDGTAWQATTADAVMAELDKYFALNDLGNIVSAGVRRGPPPAVKKSKSGAAHWLVYLNFLEVHEWVTVTGGDYT